MSWWWPALISIAIAVLLAWAALVIALLIVKPDRVQLREALRLLPTLLKLVHGLARDPELPRGVRVRLGLLLLYLAMPIDLIPDFIPILGYADDAIIVTAVLRSTVRKAGIAAVRKHWSGSEDSFAALCRLAGLRPDAP